MTPKLCPFFPAGYCIITYLLGVGDRHLDNLLLTKNGNLFHIDFGYILGRDPKPFPPPMKLSREMVEGMGGVNSDHYQQFRKFCYTAFLHLRRNANLILNLFTLMVDATIPDIALEPDKTVKKVQDKFRLDLSEEEAVHFIQGLIEESATAVMASLVEQVHKFAQVSVSHTFHRVTCFLLFFFFPLTVLEKVNKVRVHCIRQNVTQPIKDTRCPCLTAQVFFSFISLPPLDCSFFSLQLSLCLCGSVHCSCCSSLLPHSHSLPPLALAVIVVARAGVLVH